MPLQWLGGMVGRHLPGSATSWLTQDSGASGTDNHGLGMAENGGDPVTSWTLNIHKVAVWVLDQTLQLVLPLFLSWLRLQQVSCKRHGCLLKVLESLTDVVGTTCTEDVTN